MVGDIAISLYTTIEGMFEHLIFQGIFSALLIGMVVSGWGLFFPLNKTPKEKDTKSYPFGICFGLILIVSPFIFTIYSEGYHPLYHTGLFLALVIGGIVVSTIYLQKFFNRQTSLDDFTTNDILTILVLKIKFFLLRIIRKKSRGF